MPDQLDDAAMELGAFRATGSLESLKAAVVQLDCLRLPREETGEDARYDRRKAAKIWLAVLAAIDERLDPDFDPEDVPERSAWKPAGTEGPAEHEAAKRANAEKTGRYSLQTRIGRLDERATPGAESFLRRHYATGDLEREAELEELLAEARLSLDRETRLLASRSVDSNR